MPQPYTQFYDFVLPSVPGCPQALALQAIRHAAIEFCERTGVWHIDHPAINVVADQSPYPFAPGVTGAVVHKVLRAWHGTTEIFPATLDELNELFPGNWRTKTGTPERFTQYGPRALMLVPKPAAALAGGLTAIVSLKPSATSIDIDDAVYEEYHRAIASGAKAILMQSPKKPYTDLEQAAVEMGAFEKAIGEAHQRVSKQFSRTRRRTKSYFI